MQRAEAVRKQIPVLSYPLLDVLFHVNEVKALPSSGLCVHHGNGGSPIPQAEVLEEAALRAGLTQSR